MMETGIADGIAVAERIMREIDALQPDNNLSSSVPPICQRHTYTFTRLARSLSDLRLSGYGLMS